MVILFQRVMNQTSGSAIMSIRVISFRRMFGSTDSAIARSRGVSASGSPVAWIIMNGEPIISGVAGL